MFVLSSSGKSSFEINEKDFSDGICFIIYDQYLVNIDLFCISRNPSSILGKLLICQVNNNISIRNTEKYIERDALCVLSSKNNSFSIISLWIAS